MKNIRKILGNDYLGNIFFFFYWYFNLYHKYSRSSRILTKGNIFTSLEVEGILWAFIISIPMYDLYIHMMKKGKYCYKIYDIKGKALKVIGYYLLLIIIGTLITCIFEIMFDYANKYQECIYYKGI